MFKPSQLPAGTRIDDKVHGFWTKDSDNVWFLDNPHCVECDEMVLQGDPTPAENKMMDNVWKYHDTPADEFFTDFKIICLPYELFVDVIEKQTRGSGVPVEVFISFMLKDYNDKDKA